MNSPSWPLRAILGFIAAVLATLIFHQAMWEALHLMGKMPPPFPMTPTQPFGVPRIASLCFWAGLYGAVFGLAMPRLPRPLWLSGLLLGIVAALVGLLVVTTIKGQQIGAGFVPIIWGISLLINGFWGIGVGLITPLLMPRAVRNDAG